MGADLYAAYLDALEQAFDGVWDWKISEGVETYSPKFRNLLGFSKDEFPDTPDSWRRQIHPDDLGPALAEYEKHAKTHGDHPYRLTVRYRHRDGGLVYVVCRGEVVEWGAGGEPLRMIGVHADITGLYNVTLAPRGE